MQEKLKFNVIELTDGRIIFNNSVQKLGEVPETLIFNNRKELADYINPQVASAENAHSYSEAWINASDKAYGEPPYARVQFTNTLPGAGYKVIIAGDQIKALMLEAETHGYHGRVQDYIAALEAAMSFIGKHGVTIKAPVKASPDNLQDDGK